MMFLKSNLRKIVLGVFAAVAVFFGIRQIGKELILPFPNEIKLQNSTDFYMDTAGPSAIIDSSNEKIVFLDENQKVVSVDNLKGNSSISKAYSITRDDNYFYVLGEKYARNTNLVTNRRVIRYDLTGNNTGVLFDVPKDMTGTTSRQKIFTDGEKFIFVDGVALGDATKECRVGTVRYENGEALVDIRKEERINSILDAAYLPQKDTLYILDYEDHVLKLSPNETEIVDLDNNRHAGAISCLSDGTPVLCDVCSGDLYTTDGRVYANNPVYNLSVSNDYIFGSGYTNDQTMIKIDARTGNKEIINAYKYSFLYELDAIFTLLSLIYLSVLLIFFLLRLISKRKTNRNEPERRASIIMFLGIIAAVGVALFYSFNMNNQIHEDMKSELILESKFISEVYADYLKNNDEFGRAGSLKEACDAINKRSRSEHELFQKYIAAADEQQKFGAIVIFERVGDKFVLSFDSSDSFVPGQQLWYVNEELVVSQKGETMVIDKFGSFRECSFMPIYDGNNRVLGAIGYGRDFAVFNDQTLTVSIEIAMTLFTIAIIIYMGSAELMAFIESVKKKKENPNAQNTEIYFTQTFTFVKGMLMYMDDALMVIVANEMLAKRGEGILSFALLISLLTVAKGAGGTLGSILFMILPKRFSSKRNLVIGSLGIALSAAGMGAAVLGNHYFLFCLWKFIFMLLAYFVYGTVDILFLNADTEKDRLSALNGRMKGNISGSVLSIMLGGFVSNLFGYSAIYFFLAGMGALAVLLFILYFTGTMKKEDSVTQETPKVKLKKSDYVRLFFSPSILVYIFFIIAPQMLALGYKNFVFPLYSSEMNLPAYYITNLVVLSKVLSDLILDPVETALKKVDYWWRIVIAAIVVGLAFIAFTINDTIVWAVMVLVIVTIFDKLTNPSLEMVWTREVRDRQLDEKFVGRAMTMIKHTFKSFREAMLSFIQGFCGSGINVAIGLASAIGGIIYALVTRNTPMRKVKDE